MENRSINIYLKKHDYETVKGFVPKGKISSLVSFLLIEYIRKQQQETEKRAIEGYQFYKKNDNFGELSSSFESTSFSDVCNALEREEDE